VDYNILPDPDDNTMLYQEAIKEYTKITAAVSRDQPKLYRMICQHFSAESMDEVKHDKNYPMFSESKDPALWELIVKTNKICEKSGQCSEEVRKI
jgi:hypothetical protein